MPCSRPTKPRRSPLLAVKLCQKPPSCQPRFAPSHAGSPGDLPRRQQLPLQPHRTERSPPISGRGSAGCTKPQHVLGPAGTSASLSHGRPPSTSQTFGGRAALQPGTSQVPITPVSRYLGISSALYLLKQLFRSCLACLHRLTGATHTDGGTRKGLSPHPVPPKHTHQCDTAKPMARPGLRLDLGKSLHN